MFEFFKKIDKSLDRLMFDSKKQEIVQVARECSEKQREELVIPKPEQTRRKEDQEKIVLG